MVLLQNLLFFNSAVRMYHTDNSDLTITLPSAVGRAETSVYFFNGGTGTVSIVGTINGNTLGYQLTNRYQFVEISSDGTHWFVTNNN